VYVTIVSKDGGYVIEKCRKSFFFLSFDSYRNMLPSFDSDLSIAKSITRIEIAYLRRHRKGMQPTTAAVDRVVFVGDTTVQLVEYHDIHVLTGRPLRHRYRHIIDGLIAGGIARTIQLTFTRYGQVLHSTENPVQW
jgi:hypothetical protein